METKKVLSGFSIVIADRAWIYVGDVEHDGEWCTVTNARNIRRWGTDKGLGQIAENGPTSDTVLDSYGTVRIPASSVITLIDTEKSKWQL